jgi:hypothetical protein
MKNLLIVFLTALMAFSCGSTKDAAEVSEEPATIHERKPAPQTMTREKRRGSIDAEQLAAQLGLTEAQEIPFIKMWNATTKKIHQIRIDNRGDRDAILSGIKGVKEEREAAVHKILTDSQLDLYYDILTPNRRKLNGTPQNGKG